MKPIVLTKHGENAKASWSHAWSDLLRVLQTIDEKTLLDVDERPDAVSRDGFFEQLLRSEISTLTRRKLLVALVRPLMHYMFLCLGQATFHENFFIEVVDFASIEQLEWVRHARLSETGFKQRIPKDRMALRSLEAFLWEMLIVWLQRRFEALVLLTTHYLLLTTYYSLLATHYLLLTTHHSLLTTRYLLLTTHYSLLTPHYSLLATHYSLLTTHHLLLTTRHLLLTTHYSPLTLTAHSSLLITDNAPLSTHYSLASDCLLLTAD